MGDWFGTSHNQVGLNVILMELIFPQIRKMGYGWVIRNAIGQMMSASSRSYTGPMDAAIAEAISVHEALS